MLVQNNKFPTDSEPQDKLAKQIVQGCKQLEKIFIKVENVLPLPELVFILDTGNSPKLTSPRTIPLNWGMATEQQLDDP